MWKPRSAGFDDHQSSTYYQSAATVDLQVLSRGSAGFELADIDRYGFTNIDRYMGSNWMSQGAQIL